ncbi:MAG: Pvc16 family protein, partial [Marinirhabdus sp.]
RALVENSLKDVPVFIVGNGPSLDGLIDIIKEHQVNQYLETLYPGETDVVTLDNIALWESPDSNAMNDKIVVSLLNLDEEPTLRNNPNKRFQNGQTVYQNTPVNVNLYVLFSSNRSTYSKSLTSLSEIIQFFQGKRVFNQTNTPKNPTVSALDALSEFSFTTTLFTPTFEQLNYVWGTLGGKSLPSVLYKVSLIPIERTSVQKKAPVITTVNSDQKVTAL